MKRLKEYRIPYTGLKLGEHIFEFEVTQEFFEQFDYDFFTSCNIEMEVTLEKQSNMMQLYFVFDGSATVICDRCGDEMDIELEGDDKLIVSFGNTSFEQQTDDILILPHSEFEIDVSQYVYEFITLAVPVRNVHVKAECNKEVIERLKVLKIEEEKKEDTDPRWDVLKNIK